MDRLLSCARVRLRAKAKDSLSLSRPLLRRVFKAIIQGSALKALQPGTQMKHLASRHGTWTEEYHPSGQGGDLLNIGLWPILGPDPLLRRVRETEPDRQRRRQELTLKPLWISVFITIKKATAHAGAVWHFRVLPVWVKRIQSQDYFWVECSQSEEPVVETDKPSGDEQLKCI